MIIPKELIVRLRARTGAGVLECRRALEEAQGDEEQAVELLRKRGLKIAVQKAGRTVNQGVIASYVHPGGRIAAMVLLRCETDFVAKNPLFTELAYDLAMHVAAMNPSVINSEEAPTGTSPSDVALLAQPYVKDSVGKQTVQEFISSRVLELKERIVVERFARFTV